ncbi:MAG TPA: hypothetical protein VMZ26_18180 [Pyrinomonadaceae bacterium]|nr:hypothetical protein [Pyrinomonadaceae bacterium]
MIEVWEKLDCESVGAVEIEAIETAVSSVFGEPAVDSPMKIARLLADEGAELRHSEIMELYVKRASHRPYDAAFANLIEVEDLRAALRSIRQMENLRRKFETEADRDGLRLLRRKVIAEKENKVSMSKKGGVAQNSRLEAGEIAEWLTLWLQSPELFETWIKIRRGSADFVSKFGKI